MATAVPPGTLKDEGWNQVPAAQPRNLARPKSGQEQNLLGEADTGGEQGVELTGGLELIEATRGGQDALPDAAVIARVLDNLAERDEGPRRLSCT